jgi:glycosyltransferase involved in cell wall biosynthesis
VSRKIHLAALYRTLSTGGDENRLLHFVRGLDRTRFDFVLVVVFPPSPAGELTDGPILSEFRAEGVEVVHLEDEPERWQSPWLRPAILRAGSRVVARLVRLLEEREIDVLDARLTAAVPLAVIAAKLAGTPVITGAQYNFATVGTPVRKAIAQVFWPWLDALVCDSELRLDEMIQALAAPPRGVFIDNGIFPPRSKRTSAEMREILDLPRAPEVKIVGQVATLLRFKGFAVLLEAAALVLARAPDTAFLFCGFDREPGFRDELLARAKELGIADRVRILGYPGPIGDIWEVVDVHAHATFFDSAPQTLVESMSLSKPAVVTAVGGIPAMVEDGVSALMVPPGKPEVFADALLRVLEDPALGARLGEGARQRYERLYRAENMVRAIEDLFVELVEAKAREGKRRRGIPPALVNLLDRSG